MVVTRADLDARVEEDVVLPEKAVVVEVDADLLARLDSVAAEDGPGARGDPDPVQRVPVDVLLLDEAAVVAEDVDAALLAREDLVLADGWMALGGDSHAGEGIGEDAVVHELTAALYVDKMLSAVPWCTSRRSTVGSTWFLTSMTEMWLPRMSEDSK
uniref:Uncharacterized protein n=1 Tax=Steinernema glaseri TaxID=37863 RepID=A0A1I8ALS0_9BILA